MNTLKGDIIERVDENPLPFFPVECSNDTSHIYALYIYEFVVNSQSFIFLDVTTTSLVSFSALFSHIWRHFSWYIDILIPAEHCKMDGPGGKIGIFETVAKLFYYRVTDAFVSLFQWSTQFITIAVRVRADKQIYSIQK